MGIRDSDLLSDSQGRLKNGVGRLGETSRLCALIVHPRHCGTVPASTHTPQLEWNL